MLSVEGVKGIVLTGLFLLTFIIGLIPVKIVNTWRRRSRSPSESHEHHNDTEHIFPSHEHYVDDDLNPRFKQVISLLNCFAAGVFLATCVLDLLPSVRRTMVHVLYRFNIYTGFPVSEFVMILGFFMILVIEQIVLTYKEGQLNLERHIHENDVKKPLLTNENLQSEHSLTGIHSEYIHEQRLEASDLRSDSHSQDLDSMPHSSLRSMILLIALSLHSVFEGLAVGLQKTTGDVLGIFAALIVHKCILSFSLGLALMQSKLSPSQVMRSVFIFSVSAPLGIGIGMGIIHLWDSTASSLIQGLLSGIATGTFLYVTFFELLPREFSSQQDRLLKVLFLILGYSTVTGVLFLSGDVKKPFCVMEDDLNH